MQQFKLVQINEPGRSKSEATESAICATFSALNTQADLNRFTKSLTPLGPSRDGLLANGLADTNIKKNSR